MASSLDRKKEFVRVIRAPLRVSLFGGGTDRPIYYEQHGSTIISFAINRHIYLIWNERPTGGCRLSYSEVEELESLKDAKHTLVKATAIKYGIQEPCTLTITSDLPKGTGLGSSSALAVCLCWLARKYEWHFIDPIQLEQSVFPGAGFQDCLPSLHGGFNIYTWLGDDGISNSSIGQAAIDIVNEYGLLLYTSITRESAKVLPNWDNTPYLHQIYALAQSQVTNSMWWTPDKLGEALDQTWQLKRQIPGVCAPGMAEQYELAIAAGALGGKLCGAGGGGCWFFLVSQDKRDSVISTLGLTEIPFQVDRKGLQEWYL